MFGQRVLQARVLRAIPSGVLAQRLGWRPERLSRLERRCWVELNDPSVTALGEALGVSEAFLTSAPVAFVNEGRWTRHPPSSMAQRERRFLTHFAAVVEEFIDQVGRTDPLPPVRLPQRRQDGSVVKLAAAARDAMGLAGGPIESLTMSMEQAGIPVVMRSPSREGSFATIGGRHVGLSVWLGEASTRPLVLMPALSSWERTRWTLAHELGHICVGPAVPAVDAEDLADTFAGELLAPIDQITPELPRHVTLAALVDLKVRWGISIRELIRHLARHHALSEDRAHILRRQLHTRKNRETGRSWGVAEPVGNVWRVERPRLLADRLLGLTGSQSPELFAALPGSVLPADVVAEVLSNQCGNATSVVANAAVPSRIQLRRSKGWRLPTHAVVVSRPTKWGNPYRVGSDVTVVAADGQREHWANIDAATAVSLYRRWLEHDLVDVSPMLFDVTELAGHDLGCWCPLVDARTGRRHPCHADVLLDFANRNSPTSASSR